MTKGATQTQKFNVKSFRTFRSSPFLKLFQQSSECLLSFYASSRKILDDMICTKGRTIANTSVAVQLEISKYCCQQDVSSSYFSIFSHGFCREPCRSHKSIWKRNDIIYTQGDPLLPLSGFYKLPQNMTQGSIIGGGTEMTARGIQVKQKDSSVRGVIFRDLT